MSTQSAAPAALQRRRDYAGSALFADSFRPFFLAAVLRIVAVFTGSLALLDYAGGAWIIGFATFAIVYGRLLVTRKPAWAEARC
jgi:uncharacterized protein involved in response to NO